MPKRYAPNLLPDGRAVFPTRTRALYGEPEVLRTEPIPGGGQMRLEALAQLGASSGPPAIRWVAECRIGRKLETIERYVQMPHHGMSVLHGADAERAISEEARNLIDWIARKRARALELPPAA